MLIRNRSILLSLALGASLGLVVRAPRTVSKPGSPASSSVVAVDPTVVTTLENLLHSPRADVRASALSWIARDQRAQSPQLIPQISAALKDSSGDVRDNALGNMGWILERCHGTQAGEAALAAIKNALKQSANHAGQLVALDLIGGSGQGGVYVNAGASSGNPFLISDPSIRGMLVSLLENSQSALRPQILRLVSGSAALRQDPAMPGAVADALEDDELSVRDAAIHLLVKIYDLGPSSMRATTMPLLARALKAGDPNVRLQAARALGVPVPPPPPPVRLVSLTGEKLSMADVPFDFNYFTAFVQPLFMKKYGGTACVDCHTPTSNTSGKFRILPPGPRGRYTLAQSRVNFVSVLAVISRKDPMQSKLLLKPLNPTTREGKIQGMHHDGGVFWQNQYDPDFEIVADWLKGAKLQTSPAKQLDFAYFERHVEPIFSTPGPDGFACITCHFSHAILHLESPETAQGKFSIEEVVNNYQSAERVVDETAPADSYIVRKPTSPREGVPGGLSHAGGIRWPDKKESWQYKALITWMGDPNLAPGSGGATPERVSANSSRY